MIDRETLAGKFVSVMLHGEPPLDAVSSVRIALRLLEVLDREGFLPDDVVDAEVVDEPGPGELGWSPSTELLHLLGDATVATWKEGRALSTYDRCVAAAGAGLRSSGLWLTSEDLFGGTR
jgi:hypothetical protein